MRGKIAVTLSAAAISLGALASPAAAHNAGAHWAGKARPSDIQVWTGNVASPHIEPLREAADWWSNHADVEIRVVEKGVGCPSYYWGIIVACTSATDHSYAGATWIWDEYGNYITDSGGAKPGAHLGYTYTVVDEADAYTYQRAQKIFCHELGHALGVRHDPDSSSDSCMAHGYNGYNAWPNWHDFDILSATYHTDTSCRVCLPWSSSNKLGSPRP